MLGILFGVFIFIFAMLMFNFLKPLVTDTRSPDNLDCSDVASISDGTKLTCLIVDGTIPYFIIVVISLVGGVITARLIG